MGRVNHKRVLITGSGGFLGAHLARRFAAEGAVVVGCGLPTPGTIGYPYRVVDLTRQLPLDLLDGQDLLLHCAGQPSIFRAIRDPVADFEINAMATIRLFQAATAKRLRIIFPSTIAVYDPAKALAPLQEEAVCPTTCYAMNKRIAEWYLEYFNGLSGLGHTALRLGYVYGPSVSRGPVADFIRAYSQSEPVPYFMSMDSVLDFLYIDDLTEAFVRVANAPSQCGGTYNLGSNRGVCLGELYDLVHRAMGRDPLHRMRPDIPDLPVKHLVLDSKRFAATFGWAPQVTIEEGIVRVTTGIANDE